MPLIPQESHIILKGVSSDVPLKISYLKQRPYKRNIYRDVLFP